MHPSKDSPTIGELIALLWTSAIPSCCSYALTLTGTCANLIDDVFCNRRIRPSVFNKTQQQGPLSIRHTYDRTEMYSIMASVRCGTYKSIEEAVRARYTDENLRKNIPRAIHLEHQSCYIVRGTREFANVHYLGVCYLAAYQTDFGGWLRAFKNL